MKKIANPLVRAFVHETLKDSHSYSYSYDSYSVAGGQHFRFSTGKDSCEVLVELFSSPFLHGRSNKGATFKCQDTARTPRVVPP